MTFSNGDVGMGERTAWSNIERSSEGTFYHSVTYINKN